MVKPKTIREICAELLEALQDNHDALKVEAHDIVFGKMGEMPTITPGIVIYPQLEGTTHALMAQATITIFCLETDHDQNEAMFKSIELAGRVLNILQEYKGLPIGAVIGFDAMYSTIAASYIEYTLKVKVM